MINFYILLTYCQDLEYTDVYLEFQIKIETSMVFEHLYRGSMHYILCYIIAC